jgi:hypothetical protein
LDPVISEKPPCKAGEQEGSACYEDAPRQPFFVRPKDCRCASANLQREADPSSQSGEFQRMLSCILVAYSGLVRSVSP